MQSKIDNLVKMYKNNKGKYLFDNVENLEFDEKPDYKYLRQKFMNLEI